MKNRVLRLNPIWMILVGAAFQPSFPNTLTVAKSGGMYATVQAGLNAANAGDTVYVKTGVYNESVAFGKSGSASGGYITLLAETGATLDGTGLNAGALISVDSKSYIKVVGFVVQNLKTSGTPIGISLSGGGSHIEIRNDKVQNIENATGNAHGIAAYGTSATPLSELIVDGNEVTACKLGQSESMVFNGNVMNFTVSNNLVHDNDNIGIDFIGFEGNGPTGQDQARSGTCVGNHVYNISSAANPTYGGERSADGIYVDGGRDIVIERNVVDQCDIAFEVASEHQGKTTSNITLRNNFASRSFQGNIMAGGYAANKGNADSIFIVGNTAYFGNGGELILQNNCSGITIQNNIFFATAGNAYLSNSGTNNTNIAVDNNLYFGVSGSSPGAWSDSHALYANPKLANAPADLHLLTGSPAINAGAALVSATAGSLDIDGDVRLSGAKIDIGADEFGAPSAIRSMNRRPDAVPAGSSYRNCLGRKLRADQIPMFRDVRLQRAKYP